MFNPRISDTLIQDISALGVKVPDLVLKAQAKHRKYLDISNAFMVHPRDLVDAAQAAIDDDRDPATDPAVQTIITAQALGNADFANRLISRAVDDYARVMSTHADTFLALLSKPFDKAAADVEAGVAVLGDIPLNEAETILARGGAAADAWSKASRGNQIIRDIVSYWLQLNQVTGFARYDRNRQVLRFVNPTVEQYYTLNLHDRKLTAWEAAQMGLTLSLADGPEYLARIANLEQQEAAEIERQKSASIGKLSDRDRRMMKQAAEQNQHVAVTALMADAHDRMQKA